MSTSHPPLTIPQVEVWVGSPAREWHGQCFAIATAVVGSGLSNGEAVYGHYLGPVDCYGYWASRCASPFIQHGWVALPDGGVLDPMRWSFENVEPYIAVFGPGSDELSEYDEGGNRWRTAARMPCPGPVDGEHVELDVSAETGQWISQQLPDGVTLQTLAMVHVHWLSNAGYDELGPLAHDLYQAVEKTGMRGLIPIDNWRRSERDRKRSGRTQQMRGHSDRGETR